MNKKIIFSLILLILLIGSVSATASFTNYQPRYDVQRFYGSNVGTYFPTISDKETCEARQDLILNLASQGCQPAVVTSDLLAEQNVPVFCQLSAFQANPLLDIKRIRNVRFKGEYPEEVAGIAFHPAKAALRSRDRLVGSPFTDNIGYAVIVLKKNPDEASLPEVVDVDLVAQLEYDANNAFGVGSSEFNLEIIQDDKWDQNKDKFSFLRGRFYLRLMDQDDKRVTVALYDGIHKLRTVVLDKGKSSKEIYLPGSYCQAAIRLSYIGFENKQKKARIGISDDSGFNEFDVYEGSKFLNNKCTVRKIIVSDSNMGNVEIRCGARGIINLKLDYYGDDNFLENEKLEGTEKENYREAIKSLKIVSEDYPFERSFDHNSASYFGEDSLAKAIELAGKWEQIVEKNELINNFLELYPDSDRFKKFEKELNAGIDTTEASEIVLVDNSFRTIKLQGLEKGPEERASISLRIDEELVDIKERKSTDIKNKEIKQIKIVKFLGKDEVEISARCTDKKLDSERRKKGNIILSVGSREIICEEHVTLSDINNFDPVVKIKVLPRAKRIGGEVNVSLKIGIEKRAIKLTPEKTKERIKNLNESIKKYESISNNLGNVVRGLKAACFATYATLTVKNLITGVSGTAFARNAVMNGKYGWKKRCEELIITKKYSTITQCLNGEKESIEDEIEAWKNSRKKINEFGEEVGGEDYEIKGEEWRKNVLQKLKNEYGTKFNVRTEDTPENLAKYLSNNDIEELGLYLELEYRNIERANEELEELEERIKDRRKTNEGSSESFSVSENEIHEADRKVRFFSSGKDKDFAAIVPFDIRNGYYVRVVSISSDIASYDSSGLPRTFEIAQVGDNGRIDPEDERQVYLKGHSRNPSILGNDEKKSQKLINKANRALLDANRQRDRQQLTIEGEKLSLGKPYAHFNSIQCQDFMSIDDCKLLFNVCDPVICPATRCNLGGKYPVADVIQQGVVGSALLCLPNIREGIAIPICLTGIKSGIDAYVSILNGHKSCLEESLETGRVVGICDEIYSVDTCEFFWRQLAPFAFKEILPRLLTGFGGGFGSSGGGEYSSFQESYENVQDSAEYFTQTYAVNSLKAFNIRSIEDMAGTVFCKKQFISLNVPHKIDSLIEPDSPVQFHAKFSEDKFSDVTIPSISQYKVFYHIYAGKNFGTSFNVYLRDPIRDSVYAVPEFIQVDTGFIPAGEFKSETKDFTAPEGYRTLCVRINNQEECGFGQVSTSFAINSLVDQISKDQAEGKDIKGAKECISGRASPLGLFNTNFQQGVENSINPEIYKRGIVRICATSNPGSGTNSQRYVNVGICDSPDMTCWLDKESVEKAISDNNVGIREATISEIEKRQKEEDPNLYSDGQASTRLADLKEKVENANDKELSNLKNKTKPELSKFLYAHHRAEFLSIRGNIFYKISFNEIMQKKVIDNGKAKSSINGGDDDEEIIEPAEEIVEVEEIPKYRVVVENEREIIFLGSERTSIFEQASSLFLEGPSGIGIVGTITSQNMEIEIDLDKIDFIYNGQKLITEELYLILKDLHGKTFTEVRDGNLEQGFA
ncbi:hypothetical protein CXT76_00350 [Candidatus Parvarchaeota archaeon]|nr:MAG: hypothetical protein CXT76_00350 [Candidatus Parvarchaeota archaeon]HIG52185.1 hypothetical protein [Candidatus Pacearchaeota archaeon]